MEIFDGIEVFISHLHVGEVDLFGIGSYEYIFNGGSFGSCVGVGTFHNQPQLVHLALNE